MKEMENTAHTIERVNRVAWMRACDPTNYHQWTKWNGDTVLPFRRRKRSDGVGDAQGGMSENRNQMGAR